MKRKQSAAAAEVDADEPSQAPLPLDDYSGDVCAALTARYGRSASAQHRHLLATAAAIGSILTDDGHPLTAESYLPAVVSALRAAGPSDPAAAAALASLLVILIPHISSLPPASASEPASSLAAFLASPEASKLPTGTVRSVVKSLGQLALHLDAAADWGAVAAPLEALLAASVDQRAKVRRCAQESVEKLFPYLERSGCAKKASSAAIDLFEKHILSVRSLAKLDPDASEAKETEAVHMLGAVAVLVPYLSKKARNTVFSGAYRLLRPRFSPLTRHVLRLMETLLEHLKAENIESELEKLISLVLAYLPYDEKKPDDTIIAALQLMRNCLGKLAGRPKLWTKVLPSAFEAVSGYLILDSKCSEDVAGLLIECIYSHVNQSIFVTNESGCDAEDSIDGAAVKSICSSINKKLRKCASPPRNVLTIVLAMFLKLGESSYVFMKDILLTLSRLGSKIHKEPHLKNVEECIGAAIVAMGPDKIHSLLPISFEEAWFTCSNMWIVPILNKYVYGASLQHFLEYIVPLAKSLQEASSRAKKARKCKELQGWSDQLWNLLPAFCRCPSDVYQNFGSLSKLLLEMLKSDRCLYKSASKGLQQLIDGTRRLSSSDEDVEVPAEVSALFSSKTSNLSCVSLQRCSKKDARKSMKVLASHSVDLLCTFADDFLESSEKRAHLKDALRSLAQISGSANICNLFLSLLKKCGLEDIPSTPENLECEANEVDGKGEENTDSTAEINNKRSLLMELISTLAEAADEDVLDLFFGFIKSSLLDSSKSCESKALFALSTILKEHHEYSLAQLDEIMMLLHGIKPDSNNAVLEGQLVCYKYLLVHMIKVNEESTSKKAFLILNELILALKSKKESRRLAYDVLLAISTSLRSSELNNGDSDLQRLFTMVMGYLSSPSPHIVSGAIAALSLLIYTDADFCVEVPNLIPSVLVLLQNKAIEVIKASLGFVKVLVTSLQSEKLLGLQADIMTGILPMSSVTKHHFKGKVILIVEILIRKCGFDAIDLVTPEKYKEFVRSVEEGRKGNNNNPADGAQSEAKDPEHHAPKRGKWAESNAESGQEEALTGKKEFFIKGAGKPHFQGGRGRGRGRGRGQQHGRGSGDRVSFRSRSEAQSGDGQSSRGGRPQGRGTRPGNGGFNRTRGGGGGMGPSSHSPRFKKPRTAAAS
nr:ribosomal RNA-processing protein 12 [Aegilops tauschii subsp. strangulata]